MMFAAQTRHLHRRRGRQPAARRHDPRRAAGEFQHAWPRFLPDGRRFLYIIRSSRAERTGVYVGSLDGAARGVMPAYSRVTYSAGHLFYVREGTLLAQPFDAGRPTLSGSPIALSGRVKYHAEGDAAFDVSPSGVLIYYHEPGQASTRLTLFDRRGMRAPGADGRGRLSPAAVLAGRRARGRRESQHDGQQRRPVDLRGGAPGRGQAHRAPRRRT